MPQPSITQQVIKFCQMGFFPICKLQNGQYRTFSPFRDKDGDFRCSYASSDLNSVKEDIVSNYTNCQSLSNDLDDEDTPTEIIGFYHHPFEPFEVGDRVVCKTYEDRLGTIIEYDSVDMNYHVEYDNSGYDSYYTHFELEPYLEKTNKEQPLELTLEEIAKKFGVEVSNLKIKK